MPQRHRWVTDEPDIPFDFDVLYEDEHIIVIDKPHFLPTTPRGMWYRSTALIRLRERLGEPQITPAHRLDRDTAGVVVFVRELSARGAYQMLFQEHRTTKTYECLAPARPIVRPRYGTVERLEPPRVFPLRRRSRIVKDRGILQAYEEPGRVNAETTIELGASGECGIRNDEGTGCRHRSIRAYALHPRTGKTHQLRVHMNSLGLPILGDPMYPRVIDRAYDDFSNPLQLVARTLEFTDPYTGEPRRFDSRMPLALAE
ncbi:23S rRNA pseudouridylate synthase [Bifidobacterium sp. SMB2]|uniref:RNA pseudouridylate synthase n=1 Tax=Bifidobacterium saimiriisciurei TaxID=2661627 RepID=A0ABX0C6W7_9BIFI|nr:MULTISPECIES: pseudouridine synthase [Bifidobacterium]NEG96582.1 23S rRNA pseudouridylate synthase [Bifidobacterium sp. SMB2]NEH10501.1 23S rRNA pseudouridylate synthase [Bifidobacterium saimiriisciurei]NEH10716.1 23S rRNA pseudouridylate synthase [Bifidobacterium saimiriisciurei]